MEQILTETDHGVDAVVASNDGTASGVVAALTGQGKAAGEIAVALASGTAMDKVEGSAGFSPGGKDLTSVLQEPDPITKANLNVVLDAGGIAKEVRLPGK